MKCRPDLVVRGAAVVLILGVFACGSPDATAVSGPSADFTSDETPAEKDFVPPTFDLESPDQPNLPGIPPGPPSIASITVKTGLDGRTPEQVIALVKSKITNPIAAQNTNFVDSTIRTTQKYFTIAVNNIFVPS